MYEREKEYERLSFEVNWMHKVESERHEGRWMKGLFFVCFFPPWLLLLHWYLPEYYDYIKLFYGLN